MGQARGVCIPTRRRGHSVYVAEFLVEHLGKPRTALHTIRIGRLPNSLNRLLPRPVVRARGRNPGVGVVVW
jgi:hypothetical protein